ncbi:unnamed protein product [Vitrella brassicaformis CCMP3155]|uniref:PAP/OAS1 substrate-binding-related domain-containing protein n=3 Tax=Vitrella brassicaformis TaxID=1169539 RepID=A0A0G4EKS5_VITBC|nr:unnamed protein product [Vitrella brassicaformis CCMP3155]|eukprot:CEL97766.1 unnamed protein product [Vitrella brassicaformis CCMP3155]
MQMTTPIYHGLRWIDNFLVSIGPSPENEALRREVYYFVRQLIIDTLGGRGVVPTVFRYGSVPLMTYLPDGDIDIGFATYKDGTGVMDDDTRSDIYLDLVYKRLKEPSLEHHPQFPVRNAIMIMAEVRVLKFTVRNIAIDLSANKIGGCCSFVFLEHVDRRLGHFHLFKRATILIKCWCAYESHTLGSRSGLMATYALETLVLCVFHLFQPQLRTPLQVLFKFLQFYANFPWDKQAVTVCGPLPLDELKRITEAKMNEAKREAGGVAANALSQLPDPQLERAATNIAQPPVSMEIVQWVESLRSSFSQSYGYHGAVLPTGLLASSGRRPGNTGGGPYNVGGFAFKSVNIVDPLMNLNNLGRSVSQTSFYRIAEAFKMGYEVLDAILKSQCSASLRKFFKNTLKMLDNDLHNYSPAIWFNAHAHFPPPPPSLESILELHNRMQGGVATQRPNANANATNNQMASQAPAVHPSDRLNWLSQQPTTSGLIPPSATPTPAPTPSSDQPQPQHAVRDRSINSDMGTSHPTIIHPSFGLHFSPPQTTGIGQGLLDGSSGALQALVDGTHATQAGSAALTLPHSIRGASSDTLTQTDESIAGSPGRFTPNVFHPSHPPPPPGPRPPLPPRSQPSTPSLYRGASPRGGMSGLPSTPGTSSAASPVMDPGRPDDRGMRQGSLPDFGNVQLPPTQDGDGPRGNGLAAAAAAAAASGPTSDGGPVPRQSTGARGAIAGRNGLIPGHRDETMAQLLPPPMPWPQWLSSQDQEVDGLKELCTILKQHHQEAAATAANNDSGAATSTSAAHRLHHLQHLLNHQGTMGPPSADERMPAEPIALGVLQNFNLPPLQDGTAPPANHGQQPEDLDAPSPNQPSSRHARPPASTHAATPTMPIPVNTDSPTLPGQSEPPLLASEATPKAIPKAKSVTAVVREQPSEPAPSSDVMSSVDASPRSARNLSTEWRGEVDNKGAGRSGKAAPVQGRAGKSQSQSQVSASALQKGPKGRGLAGEDGGGPLEQPVPHREVDRNPNARAFAPSGGMMEREESDDPPAVTSRRLDSAQIPRSMSQTFNGRDMIGFQAFNNMKWRPKELLPKEPPPPAKDPSGEELTKKQKAKRERAQLGKGGRMGPGRSEAKTTDSIASGRVDHMGAELAHASSVPSSPLTQIATTGGTLTMDSDSFRISPGITHPPPSRPPFVRPHPPPPPPSHRSSLHYIDSMATGVPPPPQVMSTLCLDTHAEPRNSQPFLIPNGIGMQPPLLSRPARPFLPVDGRGLVPAPPTETDVRREAGEQSWRSIDTLPSHGARFPSGTSMRGKTVTAAPSGVGAFGGGRGGRHSVPSSDPGHGRMPHMSRSRPNDGPGLLSLPPHHEALFPFPRGEQQSDVMCEFDENESVSTSGASTYSYPTMSADGSIVPILVDDHRLKGGNSAVLQAFQSSSYGAPSPLGFPKSASAASRGSPSNPPGPLAAPPAPPMPQVPPSVTPVHHHSHRPHHHGQAHPPAQHQPQPPPPPVSTSSSDALLSALLPFPNRGSGSGGIFYSGGPGGSLQSHRSGKNRNSFTPGEVGVSLRSESDHGRGQLPIPVRPQGRMTVPKASSTAIGGGRTAPGQRPQTGVPGSRAGRDPAVDLLSLSGEFGLSAEVREINMRRDDIHSEGGVVMVADHRKRRDRQPGEGDSGGGAGTGAPVISIVRKFERRNTHDGSNDGILGSGAVASGGLSPSIHPPSIKVPPHGSCTPTSAPGLSSTSSKSLFLPEDFFSSRPPTVQVEKKPLVTVDINQAMSGARPKAGAPVSAAAAGGVAVTTASRASEDGRGVVNPASINKIAPTVPQPQPPPPPPPQPQPATKPNTPRQDDKAPSHTRERDAYPSLEESLAADRDRRQQPRSASKDDQMVQGASERDRKTPLEVVRVASAPLSPSTVVAADSAAPSWGRGQRSQPDGDTEAENRPKEPPAKKKGGKKSGDKQPRPDADGGQTRPSEPAAPSRPAPRMRSAASQTSESQALLEGDGTTAASRPPEPSREDDSRSFPALLHSEGPKKEEARTQQSTRPQARAKPEQQPTPASDNPAPPSAPSPAAQEKEQRAQTSRSHNAAPQQPASQPSPQDNDRRRGRNKAPNEAAASATPASAQAQAPPPPPPPPPSNDSAPSPAEGSWLRAAQKSIAEAAPHATPAAPSAEKTAGPPAASQAAARASTAGRSSERADGPSPRESQQRGEGVPSRPADRRGLGRGAGPSVPQRTSASVPPFHVNPPGEPIRKCPPTELPVQPFELEQPSAIPLAPSPLPPPPPPKKQQASPPSSPQAASGMTYSNVATGFSSPKAQRAKANPPPKKAADAAGKVSSRPATTAPAADHQPTPQPSPPSSTASSEVLTSSDAPKRQPKASRKGNQQAQPPATPEAPSQSERMSDSQAQRQPPAAAEGPAPTARAQEPPPQVSSEGMAAAAAPPVSAPSTRKGPEGVCEEDESAKDDDELNSDEVPSSVASVGHLPPMPMPTCETERLECLKRETARVNDLEEKKKWQVVSGGKRGKKAQKESQAALERELEDAYANIESIKSEMEKHGEVIPESELSPNASVVSLLGDDFGDASDVPDVPPAEQERSAEDSPGAEWIEVVSKRRSRPKEGAVTATAPATAAQPAGQSTSPPSQDDHREAKREGERAAGGSGRAVSPASRSSVSLNSTGSANVVTSRGGSPHRRRQQHEHTPSEAPSTPSAGGGDRHKGAPCSAAPAAPAAARASDSHPEPTSSTLSVPADAPLQGGRQPAERPSRPPDRDRDRERDHQPGAPPAHHQSGGRHRERDKERQGHRHHGGKGPREEWRRRPTAGEEKKDPQQQPPPPTPAEEEKSDVDVSSLSAFPPLL